MFKLNSNLAFVLTISHQNSTCTPKVCELFSKKISRGVRAKSKSIPNSVLTLANGASFFKA